MQALKSKASVTFTFCSLLIVNAVVTGGCFNGSGGEGGVPPLLARDELQGKLFHEGENYYSFEGGQVVYLNCRAKGYGVVSVGTKDVLVSFPSGGMPTTITAIIYRTSDGFSYKLVDGDKSFKYTSDGSIYNEDNDKIYDSLEYGSLGYFQTSSINAIAIRSFSYYINGEKVQDVEEAVNYLKSPPTEFVAFAACIRVPLKVLKEPDTCVELVKMPYKISDGDVNVEWRNGVSMDGSDPYVSSATSPSSIFGFDSKDGAWTSVVKGESYAMKYATFDGSTGEVQITRANSLPFSRRTFGK